MATTIDTEAAAAAGVAVPVASAEEYNEIIKDYVVTSTADASDHDVGWTAQSPVSYPAPEDVPGQVYAPWQLPDPGVAIAAGHPPLAFPEHLISEDEDHPQGPEPWEVGKSVKDHSEAINARLVSEHGQRAASLEEARNTAAGTPAKKSGTTASKPSSS